MRFWLAGSCILLILTTATWSSVELTGAFFGSLQSRRESDAQTRRAMYRTIVNLREHHAGQSFQEWPEVDQMTYKAARNVLLCQGEKLAEEPDLEETQE